MYSEVQLKLESRHSLGFYSQNKEYSHVVKSMRDVVQVKSLHSQDTGRIFFHTWVFFMDHYSMSLIWRIESYHLNGEAFTVIRVTLFTYQFTVSPGV